MRRRGAQSNARAFRHQPQVNFAPQGVKRLVSSVLDGGPEPCAGLADAVMRLVEVRQRPRTGSSEAHWRRRATAVVADAKPTAPLRADEEQSGGSEAVEAILPRVFGQLKRVRAPPLKPSEGELERLAHHVREAGSRWMYAVHRAGSWSMQPRAQF